MIYNVIKHNSVIRNIIKKNSKILSSSHTIFFDNKLCELPYVAFIAPKKLGIAVKRNYAKRLLRALFTNIIKENLPVKTPLILIANNKIFQYNFCQLLKEMKKNILKVNIEE